MPFMATREGDITIPRSVLMTASSIDEIEDWLEMQNPDFIKELRRIRDEERGLGFTPEQLREMWNTRS